MIKPSTVSPGLVFEDPRDKQASAVYWKVVRIGQLSFTAENITTKTHRTYALSDIDLEGLKPVPNRPVIELDLSPLIGKRCRVKTQFGNVLVEVKKCIRHKIEINGEKGVVDVAIVGSDGEEYHVSRIISIVEVE